MKKFISAAAGVVALLGAGTAFAQAEAPSASSDSQAPASQPESGAQAEGDAQVAISPQDIDNFAKAVVAVSKIQDDASLSQAQKQSAMATAVQQSGLDPAKFNAIAKESETNPQLQQRIQAAIGQQGK